MSNQARKAPDDRNAVVVSLLNQLADRLHKSEHERQRLLSAIGDLETRSDQSERIFLTLQDKLSKQDATDISILRRQSELEQIWKDTLERLNRAEAIATRMEEAFEMQERLARRLEQAAQDKVRMLRKIEAIEQSVERTNEAIRTGALVPAGQPSRSIFVAEPSNQNAFWWQRAVRVNTTALVGVLALTILAGYGVSQWDRWRVQFMPTLTLTQGEIEQVADLGAEHAAPVLDATTEAQSDPFIAGLDATLNTNEDELAAFGAADPALVADVAREAAGALKVEDLSDMMDVNPDAVAAALNAIEPGEAGVVPDLEQDVAAIAAQTKIDAPKMDGAPIERAEDVMIVDPVPTQTVKDDGDATAVADRADIESFLRAKREGLAPLAERMTPDASLPAVIKNVEDKAFAGIPEAQHDLAAIYTAGHAGVKVDYKRAALWFEEAAAQGIANARYNLGVLYHQGLGVDKDVATAIRWYRAAAQLGHPEAQYNLGIAHIEGIGTAYDPRLAASFFEQAANAGITEAAYNLGLIYENGLLGAVDTKSAIYWYKNAADRGSPEGQVALDQLSAALNMSKKQVANLYEEMSRDRDPAGAMQDTTPAMTTPQKRSDAAKPVTNIVKTAATERTRPRAEDIAPAIPRLSAADAASLAGEGAVKSDQSLTAQVQEQLMRRGLYPGPADGIGGPLTSDALRTYQRDNGLKVDGVVNADVLAHMLETQN
ncbi:SEL1-like repeat protein [Micavibrio aeruginosavorus]|uniref:Putative peptidoglycan binding domain protein n=1 Tax=Micavibrio aeruginosavorus (strain ARL-13) TaxID=856793 RepID=G2KNP7_MICAA|nr:peptidoglycan-binding protein [Micavibrio aeruginosavorus]AEP10292.1 putative peptidoglycan binding domain protein [Micavibrio aeruginosavorus ARL-13]